MMASSFILQVNSIDLFIPLHTKNIAHHHHQHHHRKFFYAFVSQNLDFFQNHFFLYFFTHETQNRTHTDSFRIELETREREKING